MGKIHHFSSFWSFSSPVEGICICLLSVNLSVTPRSRENQLILSIVLLQGDWVSGSNPAHLKQTQMYSHSTADCGIDTSWVKYQGKFKEFLHILCLGSYKMKRKRGDPGGRCVFGNCSQQFVSEVLSCYSHLFFSSSKSCSEATSPNRTWPWCLLPFSPVMTQSLQFKYYELLVI